MFDSLRIKIVLQNHTPWKGLSSTMLVTETYFSKIPPALLTNVVIVFHVVVIVIVIHTPINVHFLQSIEIHGSGMQVVGWRVGVVKTVALIGVIRIFI